MENILNPFRYRHVFPAVSFQEISLKKKWGTSCKTIFVFEQIFCDDPTVKEMILFASMMKDNEQVVSVGAGR